MIVSGEVKARERAAQLVKRLDSELESSGNTVFITLNIQKQKI